MTNINNSNDKLNESLISQTLDKSNVALIRSIKSTHKCSGGNTIPLSPTNERKKFSEKYNKEIKNYSEDFKLENKNFDSFKRRDYCFTLFKEEQNITIHSDKFLKQVRYAILGNEICPDTGRFHYQSYIYFHNQKTFSEVRKFFFEEYEAYPHFQACKGNTQQNVNYCSKDKPAEDIYIYGEQPEQGKRVDLNELKDKILNRTATVSSIAKENANTYQQYGRTLHYLESLKDADTHRDFMTTCHWYYGKTGTGKSYKAFENFNTNDCYEFEANDKGWWENYNGQETVIINEFRGEMTLGTLLKLIDKYPCQAIRRGQPARPFISKHIIITSALHPKQIFKNLDANDRLDQLYRRIKIFLFQKCKKGYRMVDKTINIDDNLNSDFSENDD